MAFINPYGGKGEAVKLNDLIVQPLFELCEIQCEVIVTERADHAKDFLQDCDLDKIDGVVCIGGDGMFGEIFNGLLTRSAREAGDIDLNKSDEASDWLSSNRINRPPIRAGVIPGGSTDAVAMSMHGTNDVETATLHIILGNVINVLNYF